MLKRIQTMRVRSMEQRLRPARTTPECLCPVCTAQRAGKMPTLSEVLRTLAGEEPAAQPVPTGSKAH